MELTAPVKLNDSHELDEFDCGEPSIDEWLVRKARKAQLDRHSSVFVSCLKGTQKVVAYYTLSSGSINRSNVAPKSRQRNTPSVHPVTILGRMGVSKIAQGQGFATDLLQDAIERTLGAAEVVASSAMLVHPLTERLQAFYAGRGGFVVCPELSPVTMMLSLN